MNTRLFGNIISGRRLYLYIAIGKQNFEHATLQISFEVLFVNEQV